MSLEPEVANSTNWSNFDAEEQETLSSWTRYFEEKYLIKGELYEFVEAKQKEKRK